MGWSVSRRRVTVRYHYPGPPHGWKVGRGDNTSWRQREGAPIEESVQRRCRRRLFLVSRTVCPACAGVPYRGGDGAVVAVRVVHFVVASNPNSTTLSLLCVCRPTTATGTASASSSSRGGRGRRGNSSGRSRVASLVDSDSDGESSPTSSSSSAEEDVGGRSTRRNHGEGLGAGAGSDDEDSGTGDSGAGSEEGCAQCLLRLREYDALRRQFNALKRTLRTRDEELKRVRSLQLKSPFPRCVCVRVRGLGTVSSCRCVSAGCVLLTIHNRPVYRLPDAAAPPQRGSGGSHRCSSSGTRLYHQHHYRQLLAGGGLASVCLCVGRCSRDGQCSSARVVAVAVRRGFGAERNGT